ncbi:hypothetical protein E2P81_ATG05818 [Venturia nashicola]|uniref:Uncharacterized protein n=1 Tax=Venturia nashicola TaxID=86259 RepID=A0A4Z1PB69_9PEZI|nr:hypothetical protein E6O75_ATG05962 [Venturia nashicola]TLD29524.1 hypothetical protein E2P81_ATG05818 [Venturia nashicola]
MITGMTARLYHSILKIFICTTEFSMAVRSRDIEQLNAAAGERKLMALAGVLWDGKHDVTQGCPNLERVVPLSCIKHHAFPFL